MITINKPAACIRCNKAIPAGQPCQKISRGRYICQECYKKIFITKEVKI